MRQTAIECAPLGIPRRNIPYINFSAAEQLIQRKSSSSRLGNIPDEAISRGFNMDAAGSRTAHQGRALWLSTIAFTICFAVWTIFSIIGIRIKQELGLNDTQFGLLVGTPILSGSLIRL